MTVHLGVQGSKCPTGLGHLASDRPTVREIDIAFEMETAGRSWLQVKWNPGGSGREQFEVLLNGASLAKSEPRDGSMAPYEDKDSVFAINHLRGENTLTLRFLSGNGIHFSALRLTSRPDTAESDQRLNPKLKYATLESYEKALGRAGVMLDTENVRIYAPKAYERAAETVLEYLVRAYDELYRLVGVHTKYKIAVYHFPEGHEDGWGGTGDYTIYYNFRNLDLNAHREWTDHGVPHVSGYIEEMAHSFVHETHAQFGWEMVGWSLGVKVTGIVAANPVFSAHLRQTRKQKKETFERYRGASFTFPRDLPDNLVDRIHGHLLWLCEQAYGPRFWTDFFTQVRERRVEFQRAQSRDERYRIPLTCFDALPGLNFKRMLEENEISLTTDIKSLGPTKPSWNRKLR